MTPQPPSHVDLSDGPFSKAHLDELWAAHEVVAELIEAPHLTALWKAYEADGQRTDDTAVAADRR